MNYKQHIWSRAFGPLLIAAGLTCAVGIGATDAAAATDASSTSLGAPLGGCPDGFQLLSVAALEEMGPYALPPLVDAAGNNDGWVCGNALPSGEEQNRCNREGPGSVPCQLIALGLPTYNFTDNDVPGQTP